MNAVTFDFSHPIGNILGRIALLGNLNPRGFVDWLALSRAAVPYFTENVTVPRFKMRIKGGTIESKR